MRVGFGGSCAKRLILARLAYNYMVFGLLLYFNNTPQGGISAFTKFFPEKQEKNF